MALGTELGGESSGIERDGAYPVYRLHGVAGPEVVRRRVSTALTEAFRPAYRSLDTICGDKSPRGRTIGLGGEYRGEGHIRR